MKTYLINLLILISLIGANAQSVGQASPPATLSLASNPSLVIGSKDFFGYALPAGSPGTRFRAVSGLASSKGVSFESVDYPGHFLRHQDHAVKLHPYAEHDSLFAADATFFPQPVGNNAPGIQYRSYNVRECYLTVTRNNALYIVANPKLEDSTFIPSK